MNFTTAPSAILRQLADLGFLGLGFPKTMGGHGGTYRALGGAIQRLWDQHPAAAAALRSQRLAIESLALSFNAGLRDYLLPQLLAGERAGSLPGNLNAEPLHGTDIGRGWRLNGLLPQAANLQRDGFSFMAPVQLGDEPAGWVVLRSEEDGLDVLPSHLPQPLAWARACALGDVRCRNVLFREDEWLADAKLGPRLMELDALLHPKSHPGVLAALPTPSTHIYPTWIAP